MRGRSIWRVVSVPALLLAASACARVAGAPAREFVTLDAPVLALTHARVIDGTGAAGRPDHTLVIRDGRIADVGPTPAVRVPAGARVVDLTGRTVLPGYVMLHEHLFYTPDGHGSTTTASSFPPLYLAGGATTIRTAGSIGWAQDKSARAAIASGDLAGPEIDLTAPYINGPLLPFLQFGSLAERGHKEVAKWAAEGATSFKVYERITSEELRGVIEEAHARGLKVTGHLCSVTFRDAAALGIDNLEHGIWVASDFLAGKEPDRCPPSQEVLGGTLNAPWSEIRHLIDTLVSQRVAVTSTLAVLETTLPNWDPAPPLAVELMAPRARERYVRHRAELSSNPSPVWGVLLKKEMEFERAFVQAGGLLVAGTDPTGHGGVIAGFSNQREIELLVSAGFSTASAIRIATLNGAKYLGRDDRIGSIARGKQADLVVVRGDPENRISAIEEVEIVFKQGRGYDPARLRESVRGIVGER